MRFIFAVAGKCLTCTMWIRGATTLSSCWCAWKCVHIGCPEPRARGLRCLDHHEDAA
jgi:hypothetical protein